VSTVTQLKDYKEAKQQRPQARQGYNSDIHQLFLGVPGLYKAFANQHRLYVEVKGPRIIILAFYRTEGDVEETMYRRSGSRLLYIPFVRMFGYDNDLYIREIPNMRGGLVDVIEDAQQVLFKALATEVARQGTAA
jgi:hypothetical protein